MTEIERIIEAHSDIGGFQQRKYVPQETYPELANAIEQYVLKARIEELENCEESPKAYQPYILKRLAKLKKD